MKKLPLILIVSVIFGALNFRVFMIGIKPSINQGFISILFVLGWLLYGYIMGQIKSKQFLRFIALYWIIGCILTLISMYLNWFILSIPLSCIFIIPLYGVRYFFSEPIGNNLWWLAIFTPYIAASLGYFFAKVIKNKVGVKV